MTGNVAGILVEKYSAASNLRKGKMRIISGITAFNLIQEKRFAEAEVYRKPFIEIKDFSVEDLAEGLGFGFVPNNTDTKKIASEMVSIARMLSADPASLKIDEIKKSTQELVELLNVISSISRI